MQNTPGDQSVSISLDQAYFYRALAGHYSVHPHLVPVNVSYWQGHGHHLHILKHHTTTPEKALLDWADSLRDPVLSISRYAGHLYVDVTAKLFRHPILVWGAAPHFSEYIYDTFPENTPIPVDLLRNVVEELQK